MTYNDIEAFVQKYSGDVFKWEPMAPYYISRMLEDDRILIVEKDGKIEVLSFLSMGDDPDKFRRKNCWDYLEHDPESKFCYLEKFIAVKWDFWALKEVIRDGIDVARERFPNAEVLFWQRVKKRQDKLVSLPLTYFRDERLTK